MSAGQAALVGLAFLALDPKDWLMDLAAVDLAPESHVDYTSEQCILCQKGEE